MRASSSRTVIPGFLVMALLTTARASQAADSLAAVRELYASAAYDDALAALDRLRAAGTPSQEMVTIEQYRAFCLLAVGRSTDAQAAIEAVVAADPLYRPSDADLSPRVRAAFSDVRTRMLPAIVQRQYAEAKTAFDQRDFALAAPRFTQVLALLADPDIQKAASQAPLSDLQTLATGFEELAAKQIIPASPLPFAQPVPLPPAPVVAPVVPAAPRVYASGDANVVAPVSIRQDLPAFTRGLPAPPSGSLEVVIDETGAVESATMREPINPTYDRQVLQAVRNWHYKPATVDGTPVKFRKMIQIAVKPTT